MGTTRPDGKRYVTVLPDPKKHDGLHLIPDVPEDRLRLMVPSPAIARMLADRYQLFSHKERGKERYLLFWRKKATQDAPFPWSLEEVLAVDPSTLGDEAKLCEAVEYALRPETLPPL